MKQMTAEEEIAKERAAALLALEKATSFLERAEEEVKETKSELSKREGRLAQHQEVYAETLRHLHDVFPQMPKPSKGFAVSED